MEELRWQFAQGFVLAFLLIYFLLSKACRLGLVDRPDARKRHARSVPLIGGLAIFATYLLMTGPVGSWSTAKFFFLAGGGLLVLTGALDDYFDFPAWPRLLVQTLAGLCMVAAGVVLNDLGGIFPGDGRIALGWLAVPFTLVATVGTINAANMVDGIDGLSASLSLVTITALGVIASAAGRLEDVHQLVILGACIAAFLMFNARTPLRRAATAFLGDAGSLFLGFAFAWFLVDLSQGADRAMPPASAPWLLALPLLDIGYCIVRRLAARRSPFSADRRHLHHLLLSAGLSVAQTVSVLSAAAVVLAGVGVMGALAGWPEFILALGFVVLFAVYALGIAVGWRTLDRRRQARVGPPLPTTRWYGPGARVAPGATEPVARVVTGSAWARTSAGKHE